MRWKLTGDRPPLVSGDGHIWLRAAQESVFSSNFWLARRPPTLSLLYKILDGSDERLVFFQNVFANVSWATLALTVSSFTLTVPATALTLVLVLGLGLTTPVLCWDAMIRAESIGLSSFVLCFAAVLNVVRLSGASLTSRWGDFWAVTALVTGGLTAFARETNSYLLPLLALLALCGALRRFAVPCAPCRSSEHAQVRGGRWWGRPLFLALSFLAVSWMCQSTTRASGRYAFPLMNVIFTRVLPEPRKLEFFRDELKMPVSPALMARRARWASANGRAAFRSAELADFRDWIHRDGYSAYERYLLTHLDSTAAEAVRYFPDYARADFSRAARGVARGNVCDAMLVRGPIGQFPRATLALCLAAGVALVFSRSRATCVLALATLFCVLAVLTQTYICYHGDAMELERHGMLIGTLLRLGAALLGAAVATALERFARSAGAAPGNSPGVAHVPERGPTHSAGDGAALPLASLAVLVMRMP